MISKMSYSVQKTRKSTDCLCCAIIGAVVVTEPDIETKLNQMLFKISLKIKYISLNIRVYSFR